MSEVNQDQAGEQPAEAGELVNITDLNQFAALVSRWHAIKVAALEHMLRIPEGTEVSFNEGEMTPLSGELHRGFLIGLTIALSEFGGLPFVTTPDEDSVH